MLQQTTELIRQPLNEKLLDQVKELPRDNSDLDTAMFPARSKHQDLLRQLTEKSTEKVKSVAQATPYTFNVGDYTVNTARAFISLAYASVGFMDIALAHRPMVGLLWLGLAALSAILGVKKKE